MKLTAWKMKKVVTPSKMCHDNCESDGYPTDPRVLMVGLLAQPKKGLVGPDDVAELPLWSLLAKASSQGETTNHEN